MAKLKKSASRDAELELARANHAEVLALIATIERTWVKIGKLCSNNRKHQWWSKLGYRSFRKWMHEVVGRRKSTIYVAMNAVEALEDVADDELEKMTLDNASRLSRVPRSKRTPDLVKRAQTETGKEFTRTVNGVAPGAIPEEASSHFEVWGEPSLVAVAEQAIEVAMILERTDSRTLAFERVVSEFVLNHPEPELEREAFDRVEKDPAAAGVSAGAEA
jgi:hypothetical protein